MIGARVVKTALAVAFAILIARLLHLHQPQFAGIVAVLSVQPSLYRSFRHGFQQFASALMGALIGAVTMYLLGNSFVVMGIVVLVVMTLHVKIKWTNSLLLSVVIAVNTMGSTSEFFGESALNQLALVTVGTLAGALANLLSKPVHQERAEDLLAHSEGMLRALLYYISLDFGEGKVRPYLEMRQQIKEVRTYIERGKEISGLIQEDKIFQRVPIRHDNLNAAFHVMESMVERIRGVSKELQEVDPAARESVYCYRAILLTVRVQEKRTHSRLLASILFRYQQKLLQEHDPSVGNELPFSNVYQHLREYLGFG